MVRVDNRTGNVQAESETAAFAVGPGSLFVVTGTSAEASVQSLVTPHNVVRIKGVVWKPRTLERVAS